LNAFSQEVQLLACS